jgi:hypothetical protein
MNNKPLRPESFFLDCFVSCCCAVIYTMMMTDFHAPGWLVFVASVTAGLMIFQWLYWNFQEADARQEQYNRSKYARRLKAMKDTIERLKREQK